MEAPGHVPRVPSHKSGTDPSTVLYFLQGVVQSTESVFSAVSSLTLSSNDRRSFPLLICLLSSSLVVPCQLRDTWVRLARRVKLLLTCPIDTIVHIHLQHTTRTYPTCQYRRLRFCVYCIVYFFFVFHIHEHLKLPPPPI